MGLEITRKKDGSLRSKWWYGRFTMNGKNTTINLGVEIKGRVPNTLRKVGDLAFERSRTQAQVKLDGLISEAHSQKNAEKHLEELYALKSGSSIEQIPLVGIESCWLNLPSRKRRTELWEKNQCTTLRKFREFIGERHPAVKYLSQVTPRMAQEWLRHLDELGYAAATYNDKMHLLKGFFERMGQDAGIGRNPFSNCPTKLKTTVHHQPFTLDELNRILQHADGVMRSIFIVGMCTAMRQGDCCQLKWDAVDLLGAFITVHTSKTGETAEIPLFPALREEIERQPRTDKYIFPKAAKLYQCKNFGISWRVKQVLKAAKIKTDLECEDRIQNATVKGFHSLRTTWITMALSAGVPMELVRRVTGHSTVEVVLKYYFRPDREAFRSALETAMPRLLTQGTAPAADQSLQELDRLAREAPNLDKPELLERLKALVDQVAA
ncbi:tyrosine-type recombinase/integrase [Pontiellaceae bacterium B12227]|nr:tyrosine-type recombinase/integrase [Pontiellaceae bacterium B12227]